MSNPFTDDVFECDEHFDISRGRYYRITQRLLKQNVFLQNILFSKVATMQEIVSFLQQAFSNITGISNVYLNLNNKIVNCIIVIQHLDKALQDKIYDIEYDIMENFVDLDFDFNLRIASPEIRTPINYINIV